MNNPPLISLNKVTGTYRYNKDQQSFLANKDQLCEFLEKQAKQLNLTQSRICFHEDNESILQIMLVYHSKKHIVKKHMHPHKDEYLTIVKGYLKIQTYNKKGDLEDTFVLSHEAKDSLFCFIPAGSIHDVILGTNSFFIETTTGPFNESSTLHIKA